MPTACAAGEDDGTGLAKDASSLTGVWVKGESMTRPTDT